MPFICHLVPWESWSIRSPHTRKIPSSSLGGTIVFLFCFLDWGTARVSWPHWALETSPASSLPSQSWSCLALSWLPDRAWSWRLQVGTGNCGSAWQVLQSWCRCAEHAAHRTFLLKSLCVLLEYMAVRKWAHSSKSVMWLAFVGKLVNPFAWHAKDRQFESGRKHFGSVWMLCKWFLLACHIIYQPSLLLCLALGPFFTTCSHKSGWSLIWNDKNMLKCRYSTLCIIVLTVEHI